MKKYFIKYELTSDETESCLNNYESIDTTRDTDCWFDAALFLF